GIRDATVTGVQTCALPISLFGIFAFLDVPLVYFSIRWWRTQHPQPVILGGPGSGLDPRMRVSYLLVWAAFTGLLVLLLNGRYKQIGRASCRERGGGVVGVV